MVADKTVCSFRGSLSKLHSVYISTCVPARFSCTVRFSRVFSSLFLLTNQMSRLSQALQAINDRFHPMVFQRRMNFSHANPTRSLTTRQRSTVSHGFTHPGPPYDLFLTMSHVIATGVEHGVGESKINRVSDVVSNLFFLVEYTLDDPVEDLLSDSVITLHQFFVVTGFILNTSNFLMTKLLSLLAKLLIFPFKCLSQTMKLLFQAPKSTS